MAVDEVVAVVVARSSIREINLGVRNNNVTSMILHTFRDPTLGTFSAVKMPLVHPAPEPQRFNPSEHLEDRMVPGEVDSGLLRLIHFEEMMLLCSKTKQNTFRHHGLVETTRTVSESD